MYTPSQIVRLRLISHSARLVDARKDCGLTQLDLSKATQISMNRVHIIENLKDNPTDEEQIRIACILNKPIDYLFPEELLSAVKAGVFSRRKVEISGPQIISLSEIRQQELLTDGGLEEEADEEALAQGIQEVLSTLTPKEAQVLRLRYGLDGSDSMTLEEIGKEFDLTRNRIAQIEAKAFRKLRHPTRAKKLIKYLF